MKQPTVLFLCTGNYYRSRFAEEYFNHHAPTRGSRWRAISRALATELGGRNVGPISPHALRGLNNRGISLATPLRFPRSLQTFELETAESIVALCEREHRPMIVERFLDWEHRVEYWSMDDVDVDTPDNVLPKLSRELDDFIGRLVTCHP
jgi:protein-tyrosine phosphatase